VGRKGPRARRCQRCMLCRAPGPSCSITGLEAQHCLRPKCTQRPTVLAVGSLFPPSSSDSFDMLSWDKSAQQKRFERDKEEKTESIKVTRPLFCRRLTLSSTDKGSSVPAGGSTRTSACLRPSQICWPTIGRNARRPAVRPVWPCPYRLAPGRPSISKRDPPAWPALHTLPPGQIPLSGTVALHMRKVACAARTRRCHFAKTVCVSVPIDGD
jgi:hypothetical protein